MQVSEVPSQAQIKNFLKDSLLEIMSILKAECGSLFVFDGQNKELVLESFQNSKKIALSGVKYRMGEGVSGKVIESHTPVLVKDINTDRRFHKNGFAHYHTNSFISVPLVTPDGLIGLINIADKSTNEPFTEKDLEFASTLAEYACIIAYNLDLSEKLRMEKEEIDRQKALLEKYATVGKLAAGVVHEVNNPLDGIIRFTNMLLGQSDSHSVAHEYLLEIKRGLSRIENITRSLLQFSHQVNASAAKQSYAEL
ncbi:MAG: GAF domain-containing protein, partial [Candidatus Omnitrophota bacterium]